MVMRNPVAGMVVLGGVVAAALASGLAGTPKRLPDAALSSSVLFHVERVVALVAGYVGLLVIVVRAWAGHLPMELSAQGFKYAPDERPSAVLMDLVHENDVARAERLELQRRIEALEED